MSIGVLGLCPERVQRLLVTLLATGNREERSVAGTAERLGGFGKPGVDGLVVHKKNNWHHKYNTLVLKFKEKYKRNVTNVSEFNEKTDFWVL